jgi:predicted enzyme related to lactoylglutathione lyase
MKEAQKNESAIQDNNVQDSTPRVTGIGGIFFFSDNPEKTRQWYADHLGLAVNEWGSSFEFRNANRPDEINYLQWSPFKQGSEYFQPSEKEFMINYRVQHIEKLVVNLRNRGVTILDSIETFDYGKFVHIMDADGNKIELWEPVDHVFTEMGGETTK